MRPHIKRFEQQRCVGVGAQGESCYEALALLDNGDVCLVYSLTRWNWDAHGRGWPHMTDWSFDPPAGWVKWREGQGAEGEG